MRDLYKAYSAVHDDTIKEELDTSKDQISEMNLGQMTKGDLTEICEEIVEGLFSMVLTLTKLMMLWVKFLKEYLTTPSVVERKRSLVLQKHLIRLLK